MLNGLDLFSGIGGISLALQPWVRTKAYCEINRYAQKILLSRMSERELEVAPIWPDIRSLSGEVLPEINIIFGGFPCQDISCAGNGVGMGGERSGLFNHIARLVKETNPQFVFLENVPAIRTRGLNSVAQAFTELGYDYRWTIVSAREVGADHLRKRWFLLAHTNGKSKELRQSEKRFKDLQLIRNGESRNLANTSSTERIRQRPKQSRTQSGFTNNGWWPPEPRVGRVVNGLPYRVDRVKALGNSVVPAQTKEAFTRLMGLK